VDVLGEESDSISMRSEYISMLEVETNSDIYIYIYIYIDST
jgi:hypothetical protein